MTLQFDLFGSSEARDAGMNAAVGHANRVFGNWDERAYRVLLQYININPDLQFMGEDVRKYAYAKTDLPVAPHQRSWGAIITRAVKSGVIKKVGMGKVKNVKAHRANAAIWKKA